MKNELYREFCITCKKLICVIAVAAVALGMTACSDDGEGKEAGAPKAEKAAAVINGELKSDSTVIGVGGTAVSYDEYRVYSWFLKNQYEGVLSEAVWDYKLGDATVGQAAIEDILRLIIQIKVMNKAAAEQAVGLGIDEKEDIDHKADQYLATIAPEVQQANGITREIMYRIFEENEVARKVYDVTTSVEFEKIEVQAAKVLLLHLEADDTNREVVRSQAGVLAAELSSYTGNFTSFVKDKTGEAPKEVIIGNLDSRTALASTALSMQRYTTSGVVEEKDGFYIMYCLKTSTERLNNIYWQQYISEEQNRIFQTAYENWSEKYEVKVSKSLLTK